MLHASCFLDLQPVLLLASLLYTVCWASLRVLVDLPFSVLKSCLGWTARPSGSCRFYEGEVHHTRSQPVPHSFRYKVRMAVISLDQTPLWFQNQAKDHLTAAEARRAAGTAGPVQLLTNPRSAGYTQNPISVYYCHNAAGDLVTCIAEVTNTPWGAKCSFLFRPEGDKHPKALHVSPFMDMRSQWHISAPEPGGQLALTVDVSHPDLANFFRATLRGKLAQAPQARNEEAGLTTLLRYGYQPQRTALQIYWQALQLMCKGITYFPPPERGQTTGILQPAAAGTDRHENTGIILI